MSDKAIDNLDCQTLGLYCKLLRFGESWDMNVPGLAKVLGMSERVVRKSTVTLEAYGFIKRVPSQGESGRLGGWEWLVYGNPVAEDERSSAGKAKCSNLPSCTKTVKTVSRHDGAPSRRSADMTVNGKDYYIQTYNNKQTYKNKHTGSEYYARTREERRLDFEVEVMRHTEYPTPMLEKFIRYWTEPNDKLDLLKFEMQDTWSTESRLASWSEREFKERTTTCHDYGATERILQQIERAKS